MKLVKMLILVIKIEMLNEARSDMLNVDNIIDVYDTVNNVDDSIDDVGADNINNHDVDDNTNDLHKTQKAMWPCKP